MNWYRATLSLGGPSGTLWQADTIFGHLCWALRREKGEAALRDFLDWFKAGEPLFLLSDGFPPDALPRPLTFTLPQSDDPEAFARARILRRMAYLTLDDFGRVVRGELFWPEASASRTLKPLQPHVTLKNQANRLGGGVGEGKLFGFVEHWLATVVIYLKVSKGHEVLVEELLQGLQRHGYGKRKSVGYGAIDDVRFEPFAGFPAPEDANSFVTLSPFVPAPNDPVEGRWRTYVKYGKLGEEFAVGANPFKRPLIMLTPGSVFLDKPTREHYGSMVEGVSKEYPDVVHYAYALPVAMKSRISSDGTGG